MTDAGMDKCCLWLDNWTQFPLLSPLVRMKTGRIFRWPSVILPSERGSVVTSSDVSESVADADSLSSGTVSWVLRCPQGDRRLVIMWSVPTDHHRNHSLGLGLTSPRVSKQHPGDAWFDQMYNCGSQLSGLLHYATALYRVNVDPTVLRDKDFEVEGLLTTLPRPQVKVVVRPRNHAHFPAPITALLQGPRLPLLGRPISGIVLPGGDSSKSSVQSCSTNTAELGLRPPLSASCPKPDPCWRTCACIDCRSAADASLSRPSLKAAAGSSSDAVEIHRATESKGDDALEINRAVESKGNTLEINRPAESIINVVEINRAEQSKGNAVEITSAAESYINGVEIIRAAESNSNDSNRVEIIKAT